VIEGDAPADLELLERTSHVARRTPHQVMLRLLGLRAEWWISCSAGIPWSSGR
jgi:hypothetical protein